MSNLLINAVNPFVILIIKRLLTKRNTFLISIRT